MATTIQRQITVSKKKLRSYKKKVAAFLKKKQNRKYVMIAVGVVVLFFVWQKFGRTTTTTTPGNSSGTKNPPIPPPPGGLGGTGGGMPGTVQPYPPSNGTMSPKLSNFGSPEHINLLCTGSSKNWSFEDLADVPVSPGFHMTYYINSGETLIIGSLDGYKWESNFPITFQKAIVADGVDDLYFWGAQGEISRPQDGDVMSGNTSVAYQTFYFNRF